MGGMPLSVLSKKSAPVPGPAWDLYWVFAHRRMEVFWNRLEGRPAPWTDDPVIAAHRFAHCYRVLDRASQFLLKNVQAAGPQDPENLFFRTLLFKLFNLPSTWRALEEKLGTLDARSFLPERYAEALSTVSKISPIYSSAYVMPALGGRGPRSKARAHLALLSRLLSEGFPEKIAAAKSLRESFSLLRSVPGFGDFLAYQFAIDLNYSGLTEFPEMEFVVPGPGAKSGLAKCFRSLGDYSEAEAIWRACERQDAEFRARGLPWRPLPGRPLQLIDCQNLFCETDKYCRAALPGAAGKGGRTHIKRGYDAPRALPAEKPVFPASWDVPGFPEA